MGGARGPDYRVAEKVARDPQGRTRHDGVKSKYRADYHPAVAYQLARRGLIIEEIAQIIEVDERTIRRWRHAHPEFAQALGQGNEEPDQKVEDALYSRAIGHEYDEQSVTLDGRVVSTRKQLPPDVAAGKFWLTNRRPDRWKHVKAVESISITNNQQILALLGSPEIEGLTRLLERAVERLPDLRGEFEDLIGLTGQSEEPAGSG